MNVNFSDEYDPISEQELHLLVGDNTIQECAKALYEIDRKKEGRIEWDDHEMRDVQWKYIHRAEAVLLALLGSQPRRNVLVERIETHGNFKNLMVQYQVSRKTRTTK